MTIRTRVLGAVVAAGAALALAAASAVPLRARAPSEARLRVAFSARPERIETCRTLGAQELADVPEHMRQSVVCEGATARYRLDVVRDGTPLATAVVRGGGLRHDRQLYALRELAVPSGASTIEVRLTRLDSARAAPDEDEEADDADDEPRSRDAAERRRRKADEVPASLVWRETVTLAPREVLLVTYDQEARRLHSIRGSR